MCYIKSYNHYIWYIGFYKMREFFCLWKNRIMKNIEKERRCFFWKKASPCFSFLYYTPGV